MADKLHGFPFWVLSFDRKGTPDDAGAIDQFIGELERREGLGPIRLLARLEQRSHRSAVAVQPLLQRGAHDSGRRQVPENESRCACRGRRRHLAVDTLAGRCGELVNGDRCGRRRRRRRIWRRTAEACRTRNAAADQSRAQEGVRRCTAAGSHRRFDGDVEEADGTEAALKEFQKKLAEFIDTEGTLDDKQQPDSAEGALGQLEDKQWRGLLETLGAQALQGQGGPGGGVGIGDPFKKLWAGAKDALRLATYWQMKERAGTVGHKGLGAVLTKVTESAKTIRIHLLGHSFGARLVSFALQGLPDTLSGEKSPVKSLFLLQGAFSHWAFADKLPHDNTRSGALRGMASRVDGPLLTTHSLKDLAVGRSYPAASFANRDDAAAAGDDVSRWGAMGHDGAQAVQAAAERLSAPGKKYSFRKGEWLNLDGNTVIIHGGRPSGAHSDIVHPHTAWAALAAGGLV